MWSLEDYCASQSEIDTSLWPATSQGFLQALNLPNVHPFCSGRDDDDFWSVEGIPPMGRLDPFQEMNVWEMMATLYSMAAPTLLALMELWLRLFAGLLGPLGICLLLRNEASRIRSDDDDDDDHKQPATTNNNKNGTTTTTTTTTFLISILSMVGSLVLMTDTLYVLANGIMYGSVMFVVSVVLSIRANSQCPPKLVVISLVVLLASHLLYDYDTHSITFGDPPEQTTLEEGLYYHHHHHHHNSDNENNNNNSNNSNNSYIPSIVQHWPESDRTYHKEVATSWMPSGDTRTGLPFVFNRPGDVEFHRVFLATEDDEYVGLDIAFPPSSGYNSSKPIYMILHGLNGGTKEKYVKDFAHRSTAEGYTVVVMIARGLMDLPIRGWNLFHGARTSDAHAAAVALRQAFGRDQLIIGVGYSMGAIVLSNYVASYGIECPLDAAMAISGGLDLRYQMDYTRGKRLWSPFLTIIAREKFFLGKWGHRVKERLSESNFRNMIRAKDNIELDSAAAAAYSGFDDVHHYYQSASALGDIPHNKDDDSILDDSGHFLTPKKIDNVSIPLVVLHSLDDPIITWRATCANQGLMHPSNLVQTGKGNLMILLTKSGGHVGWPIGFWFSHHGGKWMSNAVMSFGTAVQEAKQLQQPQQ